MDRNDLGRVIVNTPLDIDAIDWIPHGDQDGVRYKVLWQSGTTVLGLMQIDPGAQNSEHTHAGAHHHILVMSGTCRMLDKDLPAGSYVYIPPEVPHAAVNDSDEPSTFFYSNRPVKVDPTADEPVIVP